MTPSGPEAAGSSTDPTCPTGSDTTSGARARRAPDLRDAVRWRRQAQLADTQAETADWIAAQLGRVNGEPPARFDDTDPVERIAHRARDFRHAARTERATAALLADVLDHPYAVLAGLAELDFGAAQDADLD